MAGISKDQLRKEITAILKDADLTKTSAKKVRTLLEEKLDTDLANQKKVVDDLVMEYLSKQKKPGKKGKKDDSDEEEEQDEEENGDDDDAEEEEDEDSEEDKKKKKAAPKRAAPKKKAKATSDSDDEPSGDEKDSEDEYSPKKKAKPTPKKGKKGKKKAGSESDSDEDWAKSKPKKRGGGGGQPKGYARPLTLSKDLAKLMGESMLARHEVVKRMWALIKERNLYDPSNKQFAICDDELLKVIGEKRFRIFGMMKFLKGHFS